jgi:hypothetical protein
MSSIGLYDAIGVKKRVCRISKIESALTEACFILDFIPFKIHKTSVAQWTMAVKATSVSSNTNVRQCRTNHWQHHSTHSPSSRVGCVGQRILAQMSVTLGGLNLRVAQNVLHLVERATRVDQQAGEGVPLVMNPDIG